MAKRPTRSQAADAKAPQAQSAKQQTQSRREAVGDPGEAGTESRSIALEPSEEDIRVRAYQMDLERGGADGADFDDWLRAERELKQIR